MGTPDFAVAPLKYLIESGEHIAGVFTQPDKPKGRKAVLTPPPVKVLALEHNIPVYQPVSFKTEAAAQLVRSLEADVTIVAAYGKILPAQVLYAPRLGSICLHGSLLPELRGAAPIQWSIINGNKVTGITAMQMDEGIDTGDILLSRELEIGRDETAGELFERLSQLSVEVLKQTMQELKNGTLKPVKQDNSRSSYAPMLTKADSPVDFSCSAQAVHNKIRGLYPYPCAVCELAGVTVKLHKSQIYGRVQGSAGDIITCDGKLIAVCGDGNGVELITIQAPGSRAMSAAEYLRGHKLD